MPLQDLYMENTESKKITAGELALKASLSGINVNPYEAAEAALKEYFHEIEKCVEIHKKMPYFDSHDFYVCVLLKMERVLSLITPTVTRKFVGLKACPMPFYGMNVYKYHHKLHAIEELWMLGNPEEEKDLNRRKNYLNQYESRLLEYFHRYQSGELKRLMKTENNEEPDSPILTEKGRE